jgi:hypothetical protein
MVFPSRLLVGEGRSLDLGCPVRLGLARQQGNGERT